MKPTDRWAQDDILEGFKEPQYPEIEVTHGMTLTHTGSRFTGKVVGFAEADKVILENDLGSRQLFKAHDGAFVHKTARVALRAPAASQATRRFTPSGSIDVTGGRARVARASRIWVEGIHDAELLEKIWGDDLREAGVVVEPLHGADDLAAAVEEFGPGPQRRVGVLLDHLVEGSKESRIADSVRHTDVLVCGHPYLDIWQAILPSAIGIAAWPEVPRGTPWKDGVLAALGLEMETGVFWGRVLEAVSSYRDVATPLVNAVEQLIDFVTIGD
ncbi:MAG: DUF3097 family protein [bacterium]|nr:DUF3097 family protein [bacterium]